MSDTTPTDRSTAPLAAGLPLVTGRCPACGTTGLFLGDGGYVTCSLIDCPTPDAASTLLERPRPDEAQQPETETMTEEQIIREHVTTVHLISEQLVAVESWMWERLADVRAAAAADEQPETKAALTLPGPPCIPDHSLPVHCPGCAETTP